LAHPAEHGITEVPAAMVEEAVVPEVDEELRSGAVDLAGPRDRKRTPQVLQSVGRLVLDRSAGFFRREVLGHAATLDHEIRDAPVEHGVVEETVFGVLREVRAAER